MPCIRKRKTKELEKCLEFLPFIYSYIGSANILGDNYYMPSPVLIVIDVGHRQIVMEYYDLDCNDNTRMASIQDE